MVGDVAVGEGSKTAMIRFSESRPTRAHPWHAGPCLGRALAGWFLAGSWQVPGRFLAGSWLVRRKDASARRTWYKRGFILIA